jgi:hypothetical protein
LEEETKPSILKKRSSIFKKGNRFGDTNPPKGKISKYFLFGMGSNRKVASVGVANVG